MHTGIKKVFVVGGDSQVREMFAVRGWGRADSVGAAHLICFTGGADVGPRLYDHPLHSTTWPDDSRDLKEMAIFEAGKNINVPMVGICRGAQFLNVMNGGKMYQDVSDHTRPHMLKIGAPNDPNAPEIYVTSTHHQMMMPSEEGKVRATGPACDASWWSDKQERWVQTKLEHGIEVVEYENTICFQPHPEMHQNNPSFQPMRQYFFGLIKGLMM